MALAFLFGYTLTSLPLLRAGLALSAVVPIALATDTFSIAVMEIVDNGIMLAIPGAMHAGVGDILFWGSLSVALVIAGVIAFPVNRWLITKGRGHAVLHETGIHGGPPTARGGVHRRRGRGVRHLGADRRGGRQRRRRDGGHGGEHQASGGAGEEPDPVRGLAVAENGLRLKVDQRELPRGRRAKLSFTVVDSNGEPVRDFQVEHTKRVHLIVARRDLTGFQHLHPKQDKTAAGAPTSRSIGAGSYRVFADFKRGGENNTLAADLAVDGPLDSRPMAPVKATADAGDGYRVKLTGGASKAGEEAELGFQVTRNGEKVAVDDYLGAKGHLVALREGDLAYLHVHPVERRPTAGADQVRDRVPLGRSLRTVPAVQARGQDPHRRLHQRGGIEADWDRISRGYDRQLWLARRAVDAAVELAQPGPDTTFLDVGTGTGAVLRALASRPARPRRAVGVDSSAEMLARCPPLPDGWELQRADVAALPFGDASVDTAAAVYLLHVLAPATRTTALGELRRVLRPGGRLVTVTPTLPARGLSRPLWRALARRSPGLRPLDPRQELVEAGFRLERGRTVRGGYYSLCVSARARG